ncbi:hypothetical protein [Dokdonella sp.]|uniref:hypothetical protein n=1 Tax=Dokdonella sp. TaxID=2291710 RepID=UPI003C4B6024
MHFLGLLACAEASADCIPVDQIPFVISEPGSYCLVKSFHVDMRLGAAIDIKSDDVSLDFAGNTVRNTHGTETETSGVRARDQWNISISGGTLAGFERGVEINGTVARCDLSAWYRVDGMRIQDSGMFGMQLIGCNMVVSNNWIARVGYSGDGDARGISLNGSQISVIGNDVQGVVGSSRSAGGINIGGDAGIVEGNRIQMSPNGVFMPSGPAVKYRDNTTTEIAQYRYKGGDDAGGNI